jgi:hypothetical protein
MYITVKSLKKTLGKFIELTDLYIGIPMLFTFLAIFSFSNHKLFALVFLAICLFAMLPINLSKKNRMYKVIGLLFRYAFKNKEYCYFKNYNDKSLMKTVKNFITEK